MNPSATLWEGFRESTRCSRDTYPESNIIEYTLVYEEKVAKPATSPDEGTPYKISGTWP